MKLTFMGYKASSTLATIGLVAENGDSSLRKQRQFVAVFGDYSRRPTSNPQ